MKNMRTYTDDVAVASRALDLLIFLACSRTLDFASSMQALELATVERARANCAGVATFEADDTRILDAGRDMLAAAAVATTVTGATTRRTRARRSPRKTWLRSQNVLVYKSPSHLALHKSPDTLHRFGLGFTL